MAATAGVYRKLVGARIRADWQYRTSFLLFLLSQTLVAGLDLAVLATLFSQTPALAGWSAQEAALLYGVTGLSFGVADLFVGAVDRVSTRIKAGTFDLVLLRPLGSLLQLSAYDFALRRLGRCIAPAATLVIALGLVEVDWTPAKAVLIPLTVICGSMIFAAVWVATASVSFWTVNSTEVGNAFTYGGNLATQYPIDVLGSWLRRLLTFVVPLAFAGYFPVAYVLGRPDALGLPGWVAFASPAVALLAGLVARAVWGLAVRHYRSTGS